MSTKRTSKPSSKSSIKSLGNWLLANWFNLVTLLVALLALALSYQANQVARENSLPNLRIVSEAFSKETMMVTGCRTSDNYHYAESYIANEFTIANIGGRTTSLVSVKLMRGDKVYNVRVYPPQSFDLCSEPNLDKTRGIVFGEGGWTAIIVPTKAELLQLPLKIESGAGEKWMFQGEHVQIFADEKQARAAIGDVRNGPNVLTWLFEFSDGSSLTTKKDIVSYSINPNLDKEFPLCERK